MEVLAIALNALIAIVAWGILSLLWFLIYLLPLVLAIIFTYKFFLLYLISIIITYLLVRWAEKEKLNVSRS